jgi:peptidoglycan/xylan/chitin deacetylase (PgdA/CDA1 family)
MIGSVRVGIWTARSVVLSLGLLACVSAQAASATDCPGHPDALGTFRTLVVDPREHPRIGTMQYPETLPLEDHEVVLTFDDGPLPRNSNQILEMLAAQCVKATFFTIGRQAQASPEGVRKLRDAGHSIGTHTQDHPLGMNRMSIERARQEIDDGIASVKTALGDDAALAPFFRIPGLARADAVEEYMASQGIQIWSADFPADDWRHVSSSRVYDLAIKRLEDKGKGILLLHDIQARTVAALPRILHELKVRGYRIVHVVPATPERPATPTEPQQWQLHPPSETVAISRWPKIPNFVFADVEMLSAPAPWDLDGPDGPLPAFPETFERARPHAHGIPLPRQAPWPRQSPLPPETAETALPVPAPGVFEIPEKSYAALLASSPASRRAEQAASGEPRPSKLTTVEDDEPRRSVRGKSRLGRAQRTRLSHHAERGSRHAAHSREAAHSRNAEHSRRGALKRVVQVKKRSV